MALASSSRLCSRIRSRVMFVGAVKPVIVGVALGVCGRAWAKPVEGAGGAQRGAVVGLDVTTIGAFVLSLVILVGLVMGKVLRPRALGERGLRKIDSHPWWVWMLCGVMVFFALMLGASVGAALAMAAGAGSGSEQYQTMAGVAGYATALAVGAVLVRLVRATAPQAGFAAPPKSFAMGLGWLLVALPMVYSAGSIAVLIQEACTGREITDRLAHPTLKLLAENHGNVWAWATGLVAIVLAPIQEELVFRGFLQTALLRLLGRPWLSILVASLVFAAAHIGADMPWYGIAPVFVLGLAMGFAFERTRMLGTSVAMHVGFNALNVAMALLGAGAGS